MNISYHDFDRAHLQTLLPEKKEDFGVVLEQAHRNPERLRMLMMLALDYANCLAAISPDDTELPIALTVAAQAAAAIFTLAQTAPLEEVTLPIGMGPPATYHVEKFSISPSPALWLMGFYVATIVRDQPSKDLLCAAPASLIQNHPGNRFMYFPSLVETLRSLHLGNAQEAQKHLSKTQTLFMKEPFSIHEGDEGIDLYGPTIKLCARIVENDYNGFQATLKTALVLHHDYFQQASHKHNLPEGILPLGPLAMSCLARDRGIKIRIVSDYLLPQLIESTEIKQRKIFLQILQKSVNPLSWHGIMMRLSNQGIILSGNPMMLLTKLVQQGFLVHSEAEGYPHGIYTITELGYDELEA